MYSACLLDYCIIRKRARTSSLRNNSGNTVLQKSELELCLKTIYISLQAAYKDERFLAEKL